VQSLEASNGLNEERPELLLSEVGVVLLVLVDLAQHVSCIGMLHDDAQVACVLIKEALLKGDNVGVVDGG